MAAAARSPAKKCDLVSWGLVATLRPAECSVFCALRVCGGETTLLGTSNGILAADGGGSSAKSVDESDSEPVYQMAAVPGADKILAIRGGDRKLHISSGVGPRGEPIPQKQELFNAIP